MTPVFMPMSKIPALGAKISYPSKSLSPLPSFFLQLLIGLYRKKELALLSIYLYICQYGLVSINFIPLLSSILLFKLSHPLSKYLSPSASY